MSRSALLKNQFMEDYGHIIPNDTTNEEDYSDRQVKAGEIPMFVILLVYFHC